MNKPDESFFLMPEGSGYESTLLGIKVKWLAMPTTLNKIKANYKNSDFSDSITIRKNKIDAFLTFKDEISPDTSKYDNYKIINSFIQIDRDYIINITAAFPKKQEYFIKQKLIDSFFTIKEIP